MHDIDAIAWCGLREPFNVLSHWLGASVFAGLAVQLLMNHGGRSRSQRISLIVLSVTSVETLLISGIYHLFGPGPVRSFFLQADVAGIFLLIAGSMTPIHIILFRGWWRWGPLILAWTVALIGAGLKMTVQPGNPGTFGTLIFILFGWGGVITAAKLWRERGFQFVRDSILAGLVYTVGATMLVLGQPTLIPGVIGPHEVWHVAVLTALGIHWQFVFRIAREANARDFARLKDREHSVSSDELAGTQLSTA